MQTTNRYISLSSKEHWRFANQLRHQRTKCHLGVSVMPSLLTSLSVLLIHYIIYSSIFHTNPSRPSNERVNKREDRNAKTIYNIFIGHALSICIRDIKKKSHWYTHYGASNMFTRHTLEASIRSIFVYFAYQSLRSQRRLALLCHVYLACTRCYDKRLQMDTTMQPWG